MPNKLIHSTSPYLLQHAHNPVHWQEWGEEALNEAKNLDKPILVSIGYSSCHWCHVMEHQSFENNEIAEVMNKSFVCIKVDREERPDIDQIYMDAVQAMGANGGWPLNVFLTPDQKPFYGGTYFPPQNWIRLLAQIAHAFESKRSEINQSADELANHLQRSELDHYAKDSNAEIFNSEKIKESFELLQSRFDKKWGGLAKAPKFVMPAVWLWLLRYYFISKNEEALAMTLHTIRQMTRAGLYDQLGGGFARYSVDGEWFAPHFEKMLYDNAQLLSLYSEAYAITKDEKFKFVVYETVAWLKGEMTHPEGGFYSALDADSDGEEGKFYAWTWQELEEALGENINQIADYFHCTKEGNWEHGQNILICEPDQTETEIIRGAKQKMLTYREKKQRPSLDDKILTGWNAMTIVGLADCYKAFGDNDFLELAQRNILFIEKNLIFGGKVFRSFKDKRAKTEGFLEDYAFLIRSYISLYEVTFDENYLQKAQQWTNYTLENFLDEEDYYFHFSSLSSEQLIARKKEVFDNVIPSSNAVMARNLFHLGILLDNQECKQWATEMTLKLSSLITSEPVYMNYWSILFSEITYGLNEVVIVGDKAEEIRMKIQKEYLPFTLALGTKTGSKLPLFEGRDPKDETMIYVCRNKVCQLPVNEVGQAILQIESR